MLKISVFFLVNNSATLQLIEYFFFHRYEIKLL